ncbi:MAG: copper chaperone PCu(A)C [Anaerolineae bacterium]|nr:copper chaperone PCu(A)C [Anaerolineae bacterium]
MMKFRALLVTALLLAAFVSAPVLAQDTAGACDLVYLFNAWARPSIPGAPTSAAYGLLVNLSDQPDTLMSASTDAAEAVELHEMLMGENDTMMMRPVEGGFMVAPDSYTELKPGGYHIMLINLTAPLEAGSSLELTLNFERAGSVTLSVPVEDRTAMDGDMAMSGDMAMATPEMNMSGMSNSGAMSPEWDAACVGMHVVGAWARPSIPGAPTSAAYGLLVNLTDADETLVSAHTDVAEATELHEMIMGENDVMMMRPVESGIPVPAGGAAVLQPGGLHVMLIGLTADIPTESTLDLTLTFANAGEMHLTVPVHPPPESGRMGGM